MALSVGIVGLPNVGKSTIFNTLTKSRKAEASNYPFCTIDPNVGRVEVPDERIAKLAVVVKTEVLIPAIVNFVDIAGLVKGASQGEGLGNKFLANIRECDALTQVVRVFENANITHVSGEINPRSDIEIINTELLLADLATVEKRLKKANTAAKSGDKKCVVEAQFIERLKQELAKGVMARKVSADDDEADVLRGLFLLTNKKSLYLVNIAERDIGKERNYHELLGLDTTEKIIPLCAKIEEELGELDHDDQVEFLKEYGISEPGLDVFIKACYEMLGLQTYFTAGEKEVRAWTIHVGTKAPQAAGVIHTDFEKKFICAEVVQWDVFVESGGWVGAREKGAVRTEGKEYVMQEGDVVLFKLNK